MKKKQKFRSNRMYILRKSKVKNGCFLAIFGLILAMFLTSHPYELDEITHKGP